MTHSPQTSIDSAHRRVDLRGQTALVTGASSGLGFRFAQVLAAAGANVAVTARRRDRLERLASEISGTGGAALPVELDVSDAHAIDSAVGRVESELGTVSILVNNAAVATRARAESHTVNQLDAMWTTNLRGPFLLASRSRSR